MTLPSMTIDFVHELGYIYLTDPHQGIVKRCFPLQSGADGPDALNSLVLDFDTEGRLVGIEIVGRVSRVLRR